MLPQVPPAAGRAGPGPYLCCAAAPAQWRCTRCNQLSEGFVPLRRLPALRQPLNCATPHPRRRRRDRDPGGGAHRVRDRARRACLLPVRRGRLPATPSCARCSTASPRWKASTWRRCRGAITSTCPPSAAFPHRHRRGPYRRGAATGCRRSVRPGDPRTARGQCSLRCGAAARHHRTRLYDELAAEGRHALLLGLEYAWRRRLPAGPAGLPAGRASTPPSCCSPAMPTTTPAIECGDERLTYGQLRDRVAHQGRRRSGMHAACNPATASRQVARRHRLGGVLARHDLGRWCRGRRQPAGSGSGWRYMLDEAGFNVIVADGADDTPAPWHQRVITLAGGRHAVAAAAGTAGAAHRRQPGVLGAFVGHLGPAQRRSCTRSAACARSVRISAEHRHARRRSAVLQFAAVLRLSAGQPAAGRPAQRCHADPRSGVADRGVGRATSIMPRRGPDLLFSVPSLYRNLLHGLRAGPRANRRAPVRVGRRGAAGDAAPALARASGLPMLDGYGASEVLVLVLTARDGDDGLWPSPGAGIEPLDPQGLRPANRRGCWCATRCWHWAIWTVRPRWPRASRDGRFCPADLFVRTAGGGWRFAGRGTSWSRSGTLGQPARARGSGSARAAGLHEPPRHACRRRRRRRIRWSSSSPPRHMR